jgi:hypothetical protein
MPAEVLVRDVTFRNVLRYLKLPEHVFFGGTTDGSEDLDFGPHVYHSSGSMLALFARLANADVEYPYTVAATDQGCLLTLKPDGLSAADVAAVLGIGPREVTEFYGLAVRLTNA